MKNREVGKGAKLKDSNMANYGGKGHHDLREGAAKKENAWKGAGLKPGIDIWRIENKKAKKSGDAAHFGVKKWPKSKYGTFFDGDSFIVLHTKRDKKNDKKLTHVIYMWLGLNSTQDEMGVAAYKTVELDDLFQGEPIQCRVVQGHEPRRFTNLFDRPILTLSGGVESGFNHVKSEAYTPRLLWVKGKSKNLRVMQCEPSASNMNHNDVFVLDAGSTLYQWNGSSSGPFERHKAQEVMKGLKSDRLNTAGVHNVKFEVLEDRDSQGHDEFWGLIKGDRNNVPNEAIETTKSGRKISISDSMVKPRGNALFRCSDRTGKLKFDLVKQGALSLELLDPKDVFIVDAKTEIFVWVGKKASKQERREAMPLVTKFMKKQHLDMWTPVTRVIDNGRMPSAFKAAFSGEGGGGEQTEFTKEAKGCCIVM